MKGLIDIKRYVSFNKKNSKSKNVAGMFRHNFRDILEDFKINKKYSHKNERIDSSKTHLNVSKVLNLKTLEFEQLNHYNEYRRVLDERLKTVTRKTNSDSNVVANLIVQIGNKKDKNAIELNDKEQKDIIEFFQNVLGKENVIAYSIHNDETSPHMHLSVVPITNDYKTINKKTKKEKIANVLNSDLYFKNDYKTKNFRLDDLHRNLRLHLRERGYDVELENKKDTEAKLNNAEIKYLTELRDEVEQREKDINEYLSKLRENEKLLVEREDELQKKETELSNDKADFNKFRMLIYKKDIENDEIRIEFERKAKLIINEVNTERNEIAEKRAELQQQIAEYEEMKRIIKLNLDEFQKEFDEQLKKQQKEFDEQLEKQQQEFDNDVAKQEELKQQQNAMKEKERRELKEQQQEQKKNSMRELYSKTSSNDNSNIIEKLNIEKQATNNIDTELRNNPF